VEFERHDQPLLYPAFDRAELEHLWALAADLHEASALYALRRLSADEVLELEPALDASVVGGVIAEGERRVRPERFTAALQRALESRGAQVRQGEPVTALARERGGWLVRTQADAVRAGEVVLAAGVDTAELLAGLGIRLPVVAAKGYSRTYVRDPSGPRRPVYLEGPKVAVSVFDENVRVSGTLELGARGLALSKRRLTAIAQAAQRAMPLWTMPAQPRDWAGMRSLSPDGLPVIGALPGHPGLHVATAHATLGITLAPATGELLSALLLDGRHDPLLTAFDPARFVRGRRLQTRHKATTGGEQ
jgi:D-amino-acid dehydrogenase